MDFVVGQVVLVRCSCLFFEDSEPLAVFVSSSFSTLLCWVYCHLCSWRGRSFPSLLWREVRDPSQVSEKFSSLVCFLFAETSSPVGPIR